MSRVADTMGVLLDNASHHAALEREARGNRDWNHVFTLATFLLFVSALLAAIVMGTRTYSAIQGQVDEVNGRRLTLDLVANAIRANDASNSLGVGVGPEGNSLVLTEALDAGSFETRFYLYEGQLLQEYAIAGTPYNPTIATQLAPTETFDFTYNPMTGLLTVTTDQGSRDIALRSTQSSSHVALVETEETTDEETSTEDTASETTETESSDMADTETETEASGESESDEAGEVATDGDE